MGGHKFNPAKARHLDNPIRNFLVQSEKFLREIHPSKDEIWADIGAGSGAFAIPLAALVDKVYAMDISTEMLELLQEKVTRNHVSNIDLLHSEETRIPLDDNSVDGVLLAFVAHELDEPASYLKEISRILRTHGRLVIIEYTKVLSFGPPLNHRLDPQEVGRWANDAGLKKGRTWRWSRSIVGWEYINELLIRPLPKRSSP